MSGLGGVRACAQATTYEIAEESQANYRVTEQLAGIAAPNDAVGTTYDVEGAVHLDERGNVLDQSSIRVGLASLQSDQSRRDNFLGRSVLATDDFPDAVLVPTEIIGLAFPLPVSGTATFEIVGDLTIRDVTRSTVWQAVATFEGDVIRLAVSTSFTFEEFGLQRPRVAVVLSVADDIRLEASLVLHLVE